MKLLAAAAAALAVPASAFAQEPRPLTVALTAPRGTVEVRPFTLVGLRWQGPGDVRFATRGSGGRWSGWRDAAPEDDRPDAGTSEAARSRGWRLGNPYWVGPSNAIRYRVRGRVTRLSATFTASAGRAVPVRTLSIAGSPPIVPRSAWGADEQIRRGAPAYAAAVRFTVVHHTAGTNAYTRAESAAIVRGIQRFHVRSNGWNDIGYNFLVDKYGQIFEGRYGGVDRPVIGAHAEGFNTGSVGIAVLGSYGDDGISAAALTAIRSLVAWRLDVAHVDPLARLPWISGGNARYASGTPVPLRAVSGHRDTGFTSCPGAALYRQLPSIAGGAAELGLPKLYDPLASGRIGGPVRFTARLSSPRPWSVTVTDAAGSVVATGRGDGQMIDWTWDATLFPPGRYAYVVDAGPDVRPASGVVGQTASTLTLSSAQAKPATFTPNGDSQADSTLISYSLSLPALVTATLRDSLGQTLATLFAQQRPAGRHSFRFSATGVPDGRYAIVLDATASGRSSRVEVPIVVDRTLAAFVAKPAVFSPNGDRRLDQLTFGFVLAARAHVRLRIAGGATVYEGELEPGPQELRWEERVPDGRYAAVLEAMGPYGTRAQTARFAVDTRRPKLRIVSAPRRLFRVDERVTITGTIGGLRVQAVVGPGRFKLAGGAGRIAITAWDVAGNRSTARHR